MKGGKVVETATVGMSGIVSQLTTGITPATIFAVVSDVIPFVITMVPIALGLYLLRRVIKGAGKAKVKF